jgi:hypothetical protein
MFCLSRETGILSTNQGMRRRDGGMYPQKKSQEKYASHGMHFAKLQTL